MVDIKTILSAIRTPISDGDSKYNGKEPHLLIGKNDRSISVSSGEESVLLSVLPTLVRTNQYTGALNIETNLGVFCLKWGTAVIAANGTTNVSFPVAFERECFGVIASQEENDSITGLMVKPVDRTSFTLSIVGGANNETVTWFAFGY